MQLDNRQEALEYVLRKVVWLLYTTVFVVCTLILLRLLLNVCVDLMELKTKAVEMEKERGLFFVFLTAVLQ